MRLLNLLRDSWLAVKVMPPSALELASNTNGPGLLVYGEPYARYTLQQSSGLTGWADTLLTNLRSADPPLGITSTNLPATGSPARFYHASQPIPAVP